MKGYIKIFLILIIALGLFVIIKPSAKEEVNVIKEAKEIFPEFYNKFIVEVLKNFFIYNFVSCEYNELLIRLKEAILRKDDLVEFFENLDFISKVTILIVYLNFSYNYDKKNMDIRNAFAKEESYARPFIRALSL